MAANESFEIREKVSKAAAKAVHNACAKLRYECVFVGEVACFGYGGRRPPTAIEAIAIPKNQNETKTSIGDLKRLMATQTTGVDGRFNITPLNVKSIVLSFEHNQYASQGKYMDIKITIASNTDALDVQPFETIDGLQYARPEYILAHRLKLWIKAHTIKPAERSQVTQTIHRKFEIDPLLKRLAKMRKKITKWNEFDTQHIIQYCTAYPNSSAGKNWVQIGLDPKLLKPSESKPVASSSSKPTPLPVTATPSVAPPPNQASAITATPSCTSSSSSVSAPKPQQQPAAPPPPSNTRQTGPSTVGTKASRTQINLIHLAAQRTIELLQAMSLPSAICGSLACYMYGNRRSLDDAEILVIPPTDSDLKVEEVKKLLVAKDPEHFLVVPADDPNVDHSILSYRHLQTEPGVTLLNSCKVDLVLPGTLELPRVPLSMINWGEGLPLIPFSVLLLQKLRSWDHHGQATDKLKVIKQKIVVEDLRGMFDLDIMEELRNASPFTDDRLFTQKFLQDSLSRVREFCDAHPGTLESWRQVGFTL